jgi:hypothetical protein
MFTTKLDMFSIGTITLPIHMESILKPVCILDLSITKLVPKQLVKLICVLVVNLIIPPDTIKQHLPETFFHPKPC